MWSTYVFPSHRDAYGLSVLRYKRTKPNQKADAIKEPSACWRLNHVHGPYIIKNHTQILEIMFVCKQHSLNVEHGHIWTRWIEMKHLRLFSIDNKVLSLSIPVFTIEHGLHRIRIVSQSKSNHQHTTCASQRNQLYLWQLLEHPLRSH